MTYEIELQTTVSVTDETAALLEAAAIATLNYEQVASPASLSLLLTDDVQMEQLNHDFRGEAQPTDVLSFPMNEEMPGSDELYLGDIAISVPYAQRQAAAGGHALDAELQLLTVHGVLHLLGHDHLEPEEKAAMWAVQAAILTQLGAEITAPSVE